MTDWKRDGGGVGEEIFLKFISFTFYCGFPHDLWVKTARPRLLRKSENSFYSVDYCLLGSYNSGLGRCCLGGAAWEVLEGFPLLKSLLFWDCLTRLHHVRHKRLTKIQTPQLEDVPLSLAKVASQRVTQSPGAEWSTERAALVAGERIRHTGKRPLPNSTLRKGKVWQGSQKSTFAPTPFIGSKV